MVAESKILSPKEASAGQSVQVKEGPKVFSGTVVAVGSKAEVEQRLHEVESTEVYGEERSKTQGECCGTMSCISDNCTCIPVLAA